MVVSSSSAALVADSSSSNGWVRDGNAADGDDIGHASGPPSPGCSLSMSATRGVGRHCRAPDPAAVAFPRRCDLSTVVPYCNRIFQPDDGL